MEGKTITEISMEYKIKETEISIAIRAERGTIRPVGHKYVPTCTRALRTWDEREIIRAVAKLWQRRADNYAARANIWEDKATRLLQEVRP